jgi:hypothetical protein
MSTSEEVKSQNIGVNVNGSVSAQGDLVGRDKIIQNIVLVGQFLDFANVQGLIPKPSTPADFESVSEAFEATFKQRLDGDLAQATAFAGEVLREVIQKEWITGPVLPFRDIIKGVPTIVYGKLKELGYWDLFHSPGIASSYSSAPREREVLWLHSVKLLWKKHFTTNDLYGIGYSRANNNCFWAQSGKDHEVFGKRFDLSMRNDEFRVVMAGLVIDLIRLHSTASDDIKFWQGLVDMLGPEKKRG